MGGRQLPVILQFHASNRALLVIFLKGVSGNYQSSTADGGWTLTLPSLPTRRISVEPGTAQLIIQADNGDPHRFSRF